MDTSYASFVHSVDVIQTGSNVVLRSLNSYCLKEENEYDAIVHGILADGTKYELCPERDDLVGRNEVMVVRQIRTCRESKSSVESHDKAEGAIRG